MAGVCEGIRVIDLSSGRAGGIATMVLADFGADVIKIEPPGGDPERATPSWPLWLRGKRSVTLDLTQAADQQALHRLVAGADVVVSSHSMREAEQLHADYKTLSALNPGLVFCAVTAWGLHGPYADWPAYDEALVAAKSGRFKYFEGITLRKGPSFAAVEVGKHVSSQSAVAGILAALHARERTGEGQLIETSLLQGMLPFETALVRKQMEIRFPERMAAEPMLYRTPGSMPSLGYQPILSKDGVWLQFANLLEHLFQASIIQMGLAEEVFGNPRYSGAPRGVTDEAREEIREMMLRRAREKTAAEWMELFCANEDVAADVVGTAQQALYHPDLVANGEVVDQEHPVLGTLRVAGPVVNLRDTPGRVGAPAPAVGAHTTEILAGSTWEPRALKRGTPDHRPPLDGVTILEFASIVATPFACSLLGDLGARVIKVEPIGGDPGRGLARLGGFGSYIQPVRLNASKESICIDLKDDEGQAIVNQLIKDADFIIHNFRPGVPERLGIGYEQAKAINPKIIWLNVSTYGADGPSAYRPGAQPIAGAVNGGALMQAGYGFPPPPTDDLDVLREASRHMMMANAIDPDPCASMAAQTAALLALRARQVTGQGQQVFASMLSANQYANSDDALSYAGKADRLIIDGQVLGTSALRRLYEAGGGWICISAESDDHFTKLCNASGRTDLLNDARFATAAARGKHDAELISALEALFATESASHWERSLIAAGVGCVEANNDESSAAFWLEDEQVKANDLAPTARHMILGEYQRWGALVSFEKNQCTLGGGVIAGEHTDELLAELGFSTESIADLRARKIVWSDDNLPPLAE